MSDVFKTAKPNKEYLVAGNYAFMYCQGAKTIGWRNVPYNRLDAIVRAERLSKLYKVDVKVIYIASDTAQSPHSVIRYKESHQFSRILKNLAKR